MLVLFHDHLFLHIFDIHIKSLFTSMMHLAYLLQNEMIQLTFLFLYVLDCMCDIICIYVIHYTVTDVMTYYLCHEG